MAQLRQYQSLRVFSGAFAAAMRVFACAFRLAILAFRALARRCFLWSMALFGAVMVGFSAAWGQPSSDGVAKPPHLWHVSARVCAQGRCRSSVVEHSLGKGEVVGSIPPGSTIFSPVWSELSAHEERIRETEAPGMVHRLADADAFADGDVVGLFCGTQGKGRLI